MDLDLDASSDAGLLRGVARDDHHCLALLYDRHRLLVCSLARRIVGDPHLAEDVTQDVFVTIQQQAGRFDANRACVTTWIARITHSKSVDCIRHRRANAAREALEVRDGHDDPTGAVAGRLDLVRGLEALSVDHRQVIELSYLHGRTAIEIAGLVGIPLGTVKSRMFLAMRALRADLVLRTPA